ncbi:hypothetical protein B0T11DRAFT_294650 [Plectosphaerella cucumerina]|jgi:hypothetical protein|uniref:Uncharacterized protein n=1 Tax=Plectosphaerella cucumerina TaxID=40658 RepID=A0A8K0TJL0_9PEZI|nr:hypothetical protein B0T11DRAFT_294650 [Plectosphaerella cucumerina]
MADLWTHEFCLGCDKQTEGTAYCSESCRLADNDKTSMPGSAASSPGLNTPSYPWLSQQAQPQTGFFLSAAVDFSNPQPFGRSTSRTLQPSSSNTSLCSMSTVSSNTEATQLSEKTRQELQSYAASFDNARLARRRSY